MDSGGEEGFEHDRLAAALVDFQRRFHALEEEHRLALNMLQDISRFLTEVKGENAALRLRLQYLQSMSAQGSGIPRGSPRRSNTWTPSSASPSDFACAGGIHRSPASSSRDDASSTAAGWSSNRDSYDLLMGLHAEFSREVSCAQQSGQCSRDSYDLLMGLHAEFSREVSCAQQSGQCSRDTSVNAASRQAVQSPMWPGYMAIAAGAAGSAAAAPQQQDIVQMRQQLAALAELDGAQLPLQPGEGSLESIQQDRAFEQWMTTVVVRNVPARYTQERLLEVWEPDGSYNFLYLPYSVRQKRGSGYVFVNFCSHQAASDFWQKVQGTRLPGCEHLKSLDVAVADVQGLENNLRYWGNRKLSRISNANFLPIVFDGTRRVDFKKQVAAYNASPPAWSSEAGYAERPIEEHSTGFFL
eukprot:TRINITY_DN2749_c0_g2_i3.p1 TRINITY_DN2749_c0_g2~~TRINITY_DN2749_c0_g2_i3.p1  ORF type:complete len:413 (-),score=72.32 TRINITY_DN2749_c0_g2_i3:75-1313(-)